MVPTIHSWSDYGYRRLTSLPVGKSTTINTAEQIAKSLTSQCNYEAQPEGSDYWIRRLSRKSSTHYPESVSIVANYSQHNKPVIDGLGYLDDYAQSEYVKHAKYRLRVQTEDLFSLIPEGLKSNENALKFHRLTKGLFYASDAQIKTLLCSHIAPSFFELMPNGRILVFKYSTEPLAYAAAQRIAYAASQYPLPELHADISRSGVSTLRQWHPS